MRNVLFFKYDVVNCFVYVIILFNYLRVVKLLICNRVFIIDGFGYFN